MKILFMLLGILLFVKAQPCCNSADLKYLTQNSQLIVIAEVVEVKRPPGIWSGGNAFVQRVRYQVKEVLKGSLNRLEINAGHFIIQDSCIADKEKPCLSPILFSNGNQLILFLHPDPLEGYNGFDKPNKNEQVFLASSQDCGAILADIKIVKKIREYLREKK